MGRCQAKVPQWLLAPLGDSRHALAAVPPNYRTAKATWYSHRFRRSSVKSADWTKLTDDHREARFKGECFNQLAPWSGTIEVLIGVDAPFMSSSAICRIKCCRPSCAISLINS